MFRPLKKTQRNKWRGVERLIIPVKTITRRIRLSPSLFLALLFFPAPHLLLWMAARSPFMTTWRVKQEKSSIQELKTLRRGNDIPQEMRTWINKARAISRKSAMEKQGLGWKQGWLDGERGFTVRLPIHIPLGKTLDGRNSRTGSYLDALQTANCFLCCSFKDKMHASFSH